MVSIIIGHFIDFAYHRKFRHMPAKPRYTPAQIIAALKGTHGLAYLAAKKLRCDHDTILNYCKRYPEVQAVLEEERGAMIDLAEAKLLTSIRKGESWGVTLCLKTIGKHRGYVERQEVTGEDGKDVVIRVIYEQARPGEDPDAGTPGT